MGDHASAAPQRRRPRPRRRALVGLICAAALALTASGVWWAVGRDAASAAPPPAGFVHYRDAASGFELDHPAGWGTTVMAGGVLLRIGGQNAISIRRTELAQPVDASHVADLRAVTDAVLSASSTHLGMLRSEATSIGGLPGVYYLYTFDASGQRGAHTHYFAFRGRAMYSLVCQALPYSGFADLAPSFDAVVSSFRVAGP
jgi:hypothetical protein